MHYPPGLTLVQSGVMTGIWKVTRYKYPVREYPDLDNYVMERKPRYAVYAM